MNHDTDIDIDSWPILDPLPPMRKRSRTVRWVYVTEAEFKAPELQLMFLVDDKMKNIQKPTNVFHFFSVFSVKDLYHISFRVQAFFVKG